MHTCEREIRRGYSDVGDLKIVRIFRCWWQNIFVGGFVSTGDRREREPRTRERCRENRAFEKTTLLRKSGTGGASGKNWSPTSRTCHQPIAALSFVTNIDVASRDPFDIMDGLKTEMDVACAKSGADQEKI